MLHKPCKPIVTYYIIQLLNILTDPLNDSDCMHREMFLNLGIWLREVHMSANCQLWSLCAVLLSAWVYMYIRPLV